jgi:uncharacterized DUF497 family protein
VWPRIRWTSRSIDKIARHGVTVEEVERAREGPCLIRKHRRVFVAIGVSHGRFLLVVFRRIPDDERCRVITGRGATTAEKRLYRRKARR